MRACICAAALMLCSSISSAVGMPELAMKKNCDGCHAIDKKVVGPAWRDVARNYKGNNEAPIFLASKIRMGGFGVWGSLPMPGQQVTDEEARTLVKFILGLSGEPSVAVSRR